MHVSRIKREKQGSRRHLQTKRKRSKKISTSKNPTSPRNNKRHPFPAKEIPKHPKEPRKRNGKTRCQSPERSRVQKTANYEGENRAKTKGKDQTNDSRI